MTRRELLSGACAVAVASAAPSGPPKPYGALPSERQLRWHELETYSFLHFTVNTFTDKEWGYGDEDPSIFRPTAFDANAIVSALQAGGMKGVILTCKHHDGFCLWPTRTTGHRIQQGDIVRSISEAAAKHNMKFGVYLSPWDRNNAAYATPEYIQIYREQLRELLTDYGPIFEVWHDGANGGDGYYGGTREKRTIDKKTYYDWPRTWELVRKLQPGAVIFSDVGPDVRWVGNEKGIAGETCWATYDPVGADGGPASPGDVREKESTVGTRNGQKWLPAECDVSIRPGWFWHEKENGQVKTPAQLMDLYYKSVGRGASFLLNVPPDRRGLLHENDVASLRAFGDRLHRTFATNLAQDAKFGGAGARGASFGTQNLVDGNRSTYWATEDGNHKPELVVDFGRPVQFNVVRIREAIELGQRVEAFALDTSGSGGWAPFGTGVGTSIGSCRLVRSDQPVSATKARLRITKSPVSPALSELGFYMEPNT